MRQVSVIVRESDGSVAYEAGLDEIFETYGHARTVMAAALAGQPEAAALVRETREAALDPTMPPRERGRSVVGMILLWQAQLGIGRREMAPAPVPTPTPDAPPAAPPAAGACCAACARGERCEGEEPKEGTI